MIYCYRLNRDKELIISIIIIYHISSLLSKEGNILQAIEAVGSLPRLSKYNIAIVVDIIKLVCHFVLWTAASSEYTQSIHFSSLTLLPRGIFVLFLKHFNFVTFTISNTVVQNIIILVLANPPLLLSCRTYIIQILRALQNLQIYKVR